MNRQEERYSTHRDAWLSGSQIERQPVVVRNVSKTGVGIKVETVKPLVGEQVSVDFGDGDVKLGSVRWLSDDMIGVSFNR